MKKVINPIMKKTYGGRSYRVHIKIELNDGKLSISGVEGALPSGNCLGSCGQIDMHLRTENRHANGWKYMPGWTPSKMTKLLEIWDRWHLNDMKAGTSKQEAFIRDWKAAGNKYDYTAVCKALEEAGLLVDGEYKYGTKWLKEEVPQEVIEWLFSLPDAEKPCAWGRNL
jgi:hypothetical protein